MSASSVFVNARASLGFVGPSFLTFVVVVILFVFCSQPPHAGVNRFRFNANWNEYAHDRHPLPDLFKMKLEFVPLHHVPEMRERTLSMSRRMLTCQKPGTSAALTPPEQPAAQSPETFFRLVPDAFGIHDAVALMGLGTNSTIVGLAPAAFASVGGASVASGTSENASGAMMGGGSLEMFTDHRNRANRFLYDDEAPAAGSAVFVNDKKKDQGAGTGGGGTAPPPLGALAPLEVTPGSPVMFNQSPMSVTKALQGRGGTLNSTNKSAVTGVFVSCHANKRPQYIRFDYASGSSRSHGSLFHRVGEQYFSVPAGHYIREVRVWNLTGPNEEDDFGPKFVLAFQLCCYSAGGGSEVNSPIFGRTEAPGRYPAESITAEQGQMIEFLKFRPDWNLTDCAAILTEVSTYPHIHLLHALLVAFIVLRCAPAQP